MLLALRDGAHLPARAPTPPTALERRLRRRMAHLPLEPGQQGRGRRRAHGDDGADRKVDAGRQIRVLGSLFIYGHITVSLSCPLDARNLESRNSSSVATRQRVNASKTFGKTQSSHGRKSARISPCVCSATLPLDMVAVFWFLRSCRVRARPRGRGLAPPNTLHRAIGSVDERRGGVERGAGSWLLQLTESVLVVGGKKSTCKLCAPSSCSSSRPRPAAARCRWWPRTGFICNPRLHDLAQRVVGRDLIELKRSRALRTYGRGSRLRPTIARLSGRGLHAPRRPGSGGAW